MAKNKTTVTKVTAEFDTYLSNAISITVLQELHKDMHGRAYVAKFFVADASAKAPYNHSAIYKALMFRRNVIWSDSYHFLQESGFRYGEKKPMIRTACFLLPNIAPL